MPALALPALPAVTIAALSSAERLTMLGLLALQGGQCRTTPPATPALDGGRPAAANLDQYNQYIGRSAGSGQCVALVQAVDPSVGTTRTWAPGAPVEGNTGLTPGTVIATFDGSGRYANATDGSSHAAVYLGQDEHGVRVLDQWSGSPAAIRTIPWTNPGGAAANTGRAFRIVTAAA